MDTSDLKIKLVNSYMHYFNQYKIHNVTTIISVREHLSFVHNFIKILDYYEYWKDLGYETSISEFEYNKTIRRIQNALQFSNLTYDE